MDIREMKLELQRRGIEHRDLFERDTLKNRILQVWCAGVCGLGLVLATIMVLGSC